MKFSVMNLGCKVNAYESESVAALFEAAGYERTEFGEACDVAVIRSEEHTSELQSRE